MFKIQLFFCFFVFYCMYYHNEIELFSYVKSWIPHMRIVDNDELMEKLAGELKAFLEAE